ncbi:MAG: class I SAM-dependent methyltransferase [Anaerolineae bacterium]|nr:class I SAM-dependent methyltransferase [Anaerolineae bacterium]
MNAKRITPLVVIGLALAGGVIFLQRRRKQPLPCPSNLSWLLENPVMNGMAGAKKLLDRAQVAPGMRVLDVGCGPGRVTLPTAERVGAAGEVIALDVQIAMLDRVQKKLDAQGVTNVRLLHAGAGDGMTDSETFDRAFLVTVLGEIPDKPAALREIYRALKPGGILSITEMYLDPDVQMPGRIRKLADETGFDVDETFGAFPAFTMNLVKPLMG